jgi:hypothetical protein
LYWNLLAVTFSTCSLKVTRLARNVPIGCLKKNIPFHLRIWKKDVYDVEIGHEFEDWMSIRDWTSIWVTKSHQTCQKCSYRVFEKNIPFHLRIWKKDVCDVEIGHGFEDWMSIRDLTSIWVLHIFIQVQNFTFLQQLHDGHPKITIINGPAEILWTNKLTLHMNF